MLTSKTSCNLTEGIIQHAAKAVKGDGPVNYRWDQDQRAILQTCPHGGCKEITGVDFWQDMS